jgi:hypothetical protein
MLLVEALTAIDFVTVLHCAPGRRAAKRYTDPARPPDDYDAGYVFDVETVPVASLADVAALVERLRHTPTAFLIRGRLRDGAPTTGVERRCHEDARRGPAAFEPAAHRWLMVDLDNTEATTLDGWQAGLPPEIRDAAFAYQPSAKAHLSPTLRGHAFFWLDAPADDGRLRQWASAHGFDRSLYTPVQPHFVADPVFANPADDPLDRSLAVFDGGPARAAPIMALPAVPASRAVRIGTAEVGPPSDEQWTPSYVDAGERILETLGDPADHQGRRFQLCSALGGLLCKSGWPAELTAELLRTWLDVGDPAIDVEHGLTWALGAYGLANPNTATGVRELGELLGNPTVAESLRLDAERGSRRSAALTPGQAAAMVRAAPPQPEPAPPGVYPSLGEFLSLSVEPAPPKWLCRGLGIASGGKPVAVAGLQHSSKGPFTNLLALAVAMGVPFLGHAVEQGNVLCLDWETGAWLSHTRLRRMARSLGLDLAELDKRCRFANLAGGMSQERLDDIHRYVHDQKVSLVIVDSYTSAMMGAGFEANAVEYATFMSDLGVLSRQHDCVVMPVLHARKPERSTRNRRPGLTEVAGTGALAALVQTVIMLWRPDESEQEIEVSCARSIEQPFPPFLLRWQDESAPHGGAYADPKWGLKAVVVSADKAEAPMPQAMKTLNDIRRAEAMAERTRARERIQRAFERNEGSADMRRLVEIAGGNLRATRDVVAQLVDEGWLQDVGGVYARFG